MFRFFSNVTDFVARSDDDNYVKFEPSCVVPEDPGEIVRHAGPIDAQARRQLLEQHIDRLVWTQRSTLGNRPPLTVGGNTRVALLHLRG